MPTLEETFSLAQQMPPAQRLRLAAMLLEDISQLLPDRMGPGKRELEGYSDAWTEEDMKEAAAHSARYLDSIYPEEEEYPLPEETSHAQAG